MHFYLRSVLKLLQEKLAAVVAYEIGMLKIIGLAINAEVSKMGFNSLRNKKSPIELVFSKSTYCKKKANLN